MKKNEIVAGKTYRAKVSNVLCDVRVDSIDSSTTKTRYRCTNLRTGREVCFRSAMKFRYPVEAGERFPGARHLGEICGKAGQ